MTLDQIIDAERQATRAFNAARMFATDGAMRDALARAEAILNEVRHFAVCWHDNRTMDDAHTIDAIDARNQREALTNRLVSCMVPARF